MDMSKVKIRITDKAKEKIREIEESGMYLRMTVIKSGCCSYTFDMYPDKLRGDDELVHVDGVPLIIAPSAKPFINDIDINYGRSGAFKKFIVKAN